ncbi:MAG: hypothetical protein MK171_07255 [Pirellulales bacterium]|nr:hypothetical protein [Pirellulales bacterium]
MQLRSLIVLLAFLVTLGNVPLCAARQEVSLYAGWKFSRGDQEGAQKAGFDDASWQSVQVPHDWGIAGPYSEDNSVSLSEFMPYVRWTKPGAGGFLPRGIGWYRCAITLPKDYAGKRIFVEFDGVYRNSQVWVNGHPVGQQESGYLGYVCDLTDHVTLGAANTLAVKVDARKKEGWWYEGAGIYRPVRLVVTDPLHVPQWGTSVTTPSIDGQAATVNMKTVVQNDSARAATCRLETRIVDSEGNIAGRHEASHAIAAGGNFKFDQDIQVQRPTLWSPENPYLYKVISQVSRDGAVVDNYETPLGIRTFFFDPELGFFLNAKRYKLKGVCNHDDIAGLGVAVPWRIHQQNIEFLKAAGGNFLRSAHNPHSPETLDACDRLGVLVWDETRYFDDTDSALESIREMIRRDRNHPSIVVWSMGNEETKEATPEGVRILKRMHEVCKNEDPTRPSAIAQAHGWNKLGFSDIVDVMGYNWRAPKVADKDHKLYPKRVKLGSEYGFHGGAWDQYALRDYFAGATMWTGFDYRGESNWPSVLWPGGLGDLCHFAKPAFYLAQALWTREPMLYVRAKGGWRGADGTNVVLTGFTSCEELQIYVNDTFVKTIKPAGDRSFWQSKGVLRYEDVLFSEMMPYHQDTSVKVVGLVGGMEVCSEVIREHLTPSHIRLAPITTTLLADGQDVCSIEVGIYDDHGNLMQDADSLITFAVEGEGELIGVGNGEQSLKKRIGGPWASMGTASESDQGHQRTTLKGKCIAIVRASATPGQIRVTASSESGLSAEPLIIRTEPLGENTAASYAGQRAPLMNVNTPSRGLTFGELQLSATTIDPNQSISANIEIKNNNCIYPVEVTLDVDGRRISAEKFGVERNGERRITIPTPKLFVAGKHTLEVATNVNGKLAKVFSQVVSVASQPARLQVTSIDAPNYVYAKKEVAIRAAVKNIGSLAAVNEKVSIKVNGVVLSTESPNLQPGETREISCTYFVPAQGDLFQLEAGQATSEMAVLRPFSAAEGLETVGVPNTVSGKLGKALKLGGESDYLKISPIDLKNRPFTLTAWLRIDEYIEPHDEFPLFSGGVQEKSKGLHVGVRVKRPWFGFYANDVQGISELSTGKWYFLAFVQQAEHHEAQTGPDEAKETGTLQKAYWTASREIYVDGELDMARKCEPYQATLDYVGTFWGDLKANGALDEIRLYDRALSAEEVKSLFSDDQSIEDRPKLWLSFD